MNQNFSLLLLKNVYINLQKLFHKSSFNLANHYETLKLKNTCTSKDIRNSFIKLSKQNHPDINKSPNAHKEFLKIQEAYNVLSKPDSRARYDLGWSRPSSSGETYYAYSRTAPRYTTRNAWDDPSFYANRDKSEFNNASDSYYGIKGIKRVSNGTFALVLSAFVVIAFTIQMVFIRLVFVKHQMKMQKQTMKTQQELNELQETAERNGKEVQMEILRQKFEQEKKWRMEQLAKKYK